MSESLIASRDRPSWVDENWWRLRQLERPAAIHGGKTWRMFVRECEEQLGLPWCAIRKRFDWIPVAG